MAQGTTLSIPEAMAVVRKYIRRSEDRIAELPGAWYGDTDHCPLRHSFGDHVYMREIFIPGGTVLTGKIHRQTHPYMLLQGECLVVTEHEGMMHLCAPMTGISPAGVKRFVYTLTDCWWITVHYIEDNTQDLVVLESRIISPGAEEKRS